MPLSYNYSHLNTVQKGSFGESYARMAFTLAGFEVYPSEYDDRGIDFIVRHAQTGFMEIQSKATGLTANPFIYEDKFQPSSTFYMCALVLIDGQEPDLYLVRGDQWAEGMGCLNIGAGGESGRRYYELRLAEKYRDELDGLRFSSVIDRLINNE